MVVVVLVRWDYVSLHRYVVRPLLYHFFKIGTCVYFQVFRVQVGIGLVIDIHYSVGCGFIYVLRHRLSVYVARYSSFYFYLSTRGVFRSVVVREDYMGRSFVSVEGRTTNERKVEHVARGRVLLPQLVHTRACRRCVNEMESGGITLVDRAVLFRLCSYRDQVREGGTLVVTRSCRVRSNFCVGLSRYDGTAGAREVFSIDFVQGFAVRILSHRRFDLFLVSLYGYFTCFVWGVNQLFVSVPVVIHAFHYIQAATPGHFFVRDSAFNFRQSRGVYTRTAIAGER